MTNEALITALMLQRVCLYIRLGRNTDIRAAQNNDSDCLCQGLATFLVIMHGQGAAKPAAANGMTIFLNRLYHNSIRSSTLIKIFGPQIKISFTNRLSGSFSIPGVMGMFHVNGKNL